MKAKHWFNVLKSSKDEKEFETNLEECLKSLCKDVDNIIYTRQAKSNNAIKSCVLEVNNKWLAIVRLWEQNKNDPQIYHLSDIKLIEDGFKAIYVSERPKHKWVFDIEQHRRNIEKMEEEERERKNNLFLYKVTPLKDINEENISKEILCCLASLGSATSNGIPLEWCRPLAFRIKFLEYLREKGINKSDIDEFESDPELWFNNHT